MITIKKLIADAVDAELAATPLGIDQLKAAALAAKNRMDDRWPTLKNCLSRDGYLPVFSDYIDLANPAAILALIERLQVAEDAAKDAERYRHVRDNIRTLHKAVFSGATPLMRAGMRLPTPEKIDAIVDDDIAARRLTP